MDPPSGLGGLFARGTVAWYVCAVYSISQALIEQPAQRRYGVGDRLDLGIRGRRLAGSVPLGAGDSEGAMVMASLPLTAASAAIMNAANSHGPVSSLRRAKTRIASNASKLTASSSGREHASRSRVASASTSCTPSTFLV